MDIVKICLIALLSCVMCLYFQSSSNQEYSVYIAIISGLIILAFCFDYIIYVFNAISAFSDKIDFSQPQIKATVKIILTSYIAQFASDICNDANQKSLASKVDIASKFIILYLSLPIIMTFFDFLNSIDL